MVEHLLALAVVHPRFELGHGVPLRLRQQLFLVRKAHPPMTHNLGCMLVDAVAIAFEVFEVGRNVVVQVLRQVEIGEEPRELNPAL